MKFSNIKYCFVALALISMTACHTKEVKVANHESDVVKVETAGIQLLKPEKDIVLPGELLPYYDAQIYAKAKGFILKLYVDRGTHVQAGQTLAILDAPELKADAGEAAAKLANNRSQYLASRLTYQRLKQASQTKGAISLNELSLAEAKMKVDSAQVAAAQSLLQNKNKLLDYLTIKAPFSGTVTDRNVSIGDLVGPDEASKTHPLFIIEETGKLRLTIAIPEIYSSALHQNAKVSFGVSSLPGEIFTAKLSRISESIQTDTRTMMSEFDVANDNRRLKAGLFVDVTLPIQRNGKTMFVPTSSLVSSTEKQFVITPLNGKAHWVPVKKGITLDSLVEVFGEIHPDDKVVINASDELREGTAIN